MFARLCFAGALLASGHHLRSRQIFECDETLRGEIVNLIRRCTVRKILPISRSSMSQNSMSSAMPSSVRRRMSRADVMRRPGR